VGTALQHQRIPFHQHLYTSSHPRCCSGESTPHRLRLHYRHRGTAIAAPQQVRHELPGSQVPLARSQKAPPPDMRAVVSRVVAPAAVARPKMPTNQWADSRCSYGR
jgi:hypothetical protein